MTNTARNHRLSNGDPTRDLEVIDRAIADLKPAPRQTREHSKDQVRQIGKSIAQFGWTVPVLIDENDQVLAGHGRLAAGEQLGLDRVPTIRIGDLTPEQKRAYAIADNQIAAKAGWDEHALALEFQELNALDLDFDLEITGFETAEIDLLIQGLEPANDNSPADQAPAPAPVAISRKGDLWLLGDHRLLCGDATQAEAYARLMDSKRASLVFTDPPYNVKIGGHVCGLGKTQHREFAMASGEMSEAAFTGFLSSVFEQLVVCSDDGSIHFLCMDWRHMRQMLEAADRHYAELKNLCVWNKSNGGMGGMYRSKHELVFVFKNGTAPHRNNIELGKHGRNRTNVWDYAGINSFGAEREGLALHPTVKPLALVADAILDCSRRRDIVLDPFSGSGTTLIAAQKTGRVAHVMELDPLYVDVAIRRWQTWTGEQAVHADTGETFTTLMDQRRAEDPPQPDNHPPAHSVREG